MFKYIVRRILQMIPVLIGTTFIIFCLVFALPGDPTAGRCGERPCPPAYVAAFRAEYNLDKPLLVQYGLYLEKLLHGNLGVDYYGNTVVSELGARYPVTIKLAVIALLVEIVIGILAGVWAGVRRGAFIDYFVLVSSLIVISIPIFVIGSLAQLIFGLRLGWLPVTAGDGSSGALILPGLVLGALSVAYVARLTRSNLLENQRADYVRTAKAKGMSPSRIVTMHTLRNSLIPVITFIGYDFGALMGGAIADPTPGENNALDNSKPRSVWNDAWVCLQHNPLFWISVTLIVVFLTMAGVPAIFTSKDPTDCNLSAARHIPSAVHWFGTDIQGCDVYSRTVYGARSSILVGVLATLGTTILGAFIGLVAGFRGGWLDTLLSRIGDVFYAIPLLLGGIIILYTFPNEPGTPYLVMVLKVVGAIVILGWPSIARLMRSSVLQVLPHDYVQAARALGASSWRIIRSHILPNAVAPVIVVSTINLGAYIAIEATLSYLGIGLQEPAISWGVSISDASGLGYVRSAPFMLLFPSLFLSLAVLAFIFLGEAAQDAFDPKQH
ncbi:ABC transporter, permease protein [ [[Propionibacterium] namnetense SK182B-JCVI]|uniref:ABC transporter, permease protein n=1 Tax=[Propionibacterium] namnetense SK182B-JCVI TaxID=1051006 RepID=F9NUL2_9ACTN|nr:ABC transporter, permease protein [ [[Propionibacterium] namnetense SK182B-JCVI]